MYKILNVLGFSYLLWMAWKIASSTASIDDNDEKDNKPFTFIQLVVFQWLNPKAWVMAITSTSTFTSGGENIFSEVLIIAFIYFLSGIISTNTWTIGGVFLKKIIKNDKSLKIFNITMALFIVLSIIPVML